jgi:hypothetical protein
MFDFGAEPNKENKLLGDTKGIPNSFFQINSL